MRNGIRDADWMAMKAAFRSSVIGDPPHNTVRTSDTYDEIMGHDKKAVPSHHVPSFNHFHRWFKIPTSPSPPRE